MQRRAMLVHLDIFALRDRFSTVPKATSVMHIRISFSMPYHAQLDRIAAVFVVAQKAIVHSVQPAAYVRLAQKIPAQSCVHLVTTARLEVFRPHLVQLEPIETLQEAPVFRIAHLALLDSTVLTMERFPTRSHARLLSFAPQEVTSLVSVKLATIALLPPLRS